MSVDEFIQCVSQALASNNKTVNWEKDAVYKVQQHFFKLAMERTGNRFTEQKSNQALMRAGDGQMSVLQIEKRVVRRFLKGALCANL